MKRWFKAVAAGALSLAPLAAFAAIDTTHHDMTAPGYNVSTQKCAYCHSISLPSASTGAVYYGLVGTFCAVVCHDGTGGVAGALPTRPGYFDAAFARVGNANDVSTVAFSSAHGELVANLPIMDAAAGDRAATIAATGWPHSSQAELECTTCHAVHDGSNPPFLNGPLTNRTDNAGSFCQRCHTGSNIQANQAGRFDLITAIGAHPTEFVYATAPVRALPKLGREMEIKSAALWTNTGQATIAGFNAPGPDWDLGGKFMAPSGDILPIVAANDGALVGSYFGCYSCHSAHQGQTAATETNSTNLLMARMNDSAGAADGTSVLCTGCHGLAASTQNPGTTTAYHPANAGAAQPYSHTHASHGATADPNVPTGGSFPIPIRGDTTGAALLAQIPGGATYLGVANNNIMCVTCHDVHGGVPGRMALRNIDNTIQITNDDSICLACHQASTDNAGLTNNFHHRGNQTSYAGAAQGAFVDTTAWMTPENLGNMADGLSCVDCHIFQSSATHRATAHNW